MKMLPPHAPFPFSSITLNLRDETKRLRQLLTVMITFLGIGLQSEPALAFTECEARIEKIWAGDVGYVWIHLIGGGAAVLQPNDPNKESVMAMGLTALTGSRKVTIRYAANSANCNEFGRTDFVGMYLF